MDQPLPAEAGDLPCVLQSPAPNTPHEHEPRCLVHPCPSALCLQLWELFRSVEMDRECRVLSKWQEHVRELQHAAASACGCGGSSLGPAAAALAAWAGVSGRARQALKRAPPALVGEIEAQVRAFLQQLHQQQQGGEGQGQGLREAAAGAAPAAAAGGGGGSSACGSGRGGVAELVLELEDGFQRLLAHGLAEFHSLCSRTRERPDGSKAVVLRLHRAPAAAAAVSGPTSVPAAGAEGGVASAAVGAVAADSDALPITCCDILLLLEDRPEQGLNRWVVENAYCRPGDCSPSAAGLAAAATAATPGLVLPPPRLVAVG